MTKEQFDRTAFFKGQRATLATPEGIISVLIENLEIGSPSGYFQVIGHKNGKPFYTYVDYSLIELETPCPLAILREIHRRMNDVFGEGSQCRVDSDIDKWITEILKQSEK
jgi:hypothetical protein